MLNPVPTSYDYNPPTDPWIDIVHEEADFVVVDKPSGLLSVPGKDPALADSLQRRAEAHWPTAGMIHRLDKDTSGVMVLALNKRAHAQNRHAVREADGRRRATSRASGARSRATRASSTCRSPSTGRTSRASASTSSAAARRGHSGR